MNYRKITQTFIFATVLIIIGFDIWVALSGGKEATVSHVMIELSYEYPSLVFGVGFIFGHLFWRMKQTKIMTDKGI